MNKGKYITEICYNFYTITNYGYNKKDYITDKVINIYRSFLSNLSLTKENVKKAQTFDVVVSTYLSDSSFQQEVKSRFPYLEFITHENIISSLVEEMITLYDLYQEGTTKRIHIARWI